MDQIISLKVLNWSDLQKCTCALWELNLFISWETEEFVVYSNMKIIGRLVDIEGAVLIYIYEICILKNLFKGHTKAGASSNSISSFMSDWFLFVLFIMEGLKIYSLSSGYTGGHIFYTLWECDKLLCLFQRKLRKTFRYRCFIYIV